MIKVFTMFAGYGTDLFALKKLGIDYECVGFSEIDKYAIQCFQKNHGGKNWGNCREINPNELPDFDLLTGGFPCQSFSNAGQMKGELDPRGTLFYEIIRIAEVKKPKYMLLENVKGLTSKKFKETFDKILSELDRIGYNVKWKVLNSKDYGTPQNRERVWFVCIRKDIEQEFNFPNKEPLNICLKDLIEEQVEDKYYLSESQIKTLQRRFGAKGKELKLDNDDFSLIEKPSYPSRINEIKDPATCPCLPSAMGTGGGNVPYFSCALRTFPRDKVEGEERSKRLEIRKDEVANSITTHQYDSMLVQITNVSPREVGFHNECPCICARDYKEPKVVDCYNMKVKEDGISIALTDPNHNNLRLMENKIHNCITEAIGRQGSSKEFLGSCEKVYETTRTLRKLTPNECFRLMGFYNDEINLDGLSDTQRYKLAGNGQDVNVVSRILRNLICYEDGIE